MAWASSGGYPGVVSNGSGGLNVSGSVTASHIHVKAGGNLDLRDINGAVIANLETLGGLGALLLTGSTGLFGHASPAAATVGGAATAGGTYTAVEQAMLEATYTALRSIGLIT